MTRLLGMARGIIRPEFTSKHCKRKALGGPSAHSKEEHDKKNKKNNPINNPISAQGLKAANDAENRKAIAAQGLGNTMRSKADTKLLCEHLLAIKKYAIPGNMTMSRQSCRPAWLVALHAAACTSVVRGSP
jgi:hypothetical protein